MEAKKPRTTPSLLLPSWLPLSRAWKSSIIDLNPLILWGVLEKKRSWLIFIKEVRCFEVKKAINHELEAHSHSGGGEEDEEERVTVVVASTIMEKGEEMRYLWETFQEWAVVIIPPIWGRCGLSLATYSGYSPDISILVSIGLFP